MSDAKLREALVRIRLRAGNADRTFDDCIRDMVWIDDECRAALAAEPASGEGIATNDTLIAAPPPPPTQGEEAFDGPIMAQLVQNNNILRARVAKLEEALLDATAHLAGATSAYEKFVGRHNRQGHRDALFETRFSDFTKATDRARAALAPPPPPTQGELRKLLADAFIVVAQDEWGSYLGDMSAKAALAELEAALRQRADAATRAENEACELLLLRERDKFSINSDKWHSFQGLAAAIRARIAPKGEA